MFLDSNTAARRCVSSPAEIVAPTLHVLCLNASMCVHHAEYTVPEASRTAVCAAARVHWVRTAVFTGLCSLQLAGVS